MAFGLGKPSPGQKPPKNQNRNKVDNGSKKGSQVKIVQRGARELILTDKLPSAFDNLPPAILLLAAPRRLFCFGSLVILDVVCCYLLFSCYI